MKAPAWVCMVGACFAASDDLIREFRENVVGLQVQMVRKSGAVGALELGEEFSVKIKVPSSGYLYVIQHDPESPADAVVFPGAGEGNGVVSEGLKIIELKAEGHRSKTVLFAIFSLKPLALARQGPALEIVKRLRPLAARWAELSFSVK